jgi:signal transduction histidine kinase
LQVKVTAAPDPLPPLPAAVEVAAYRIALEGITNVVRHARAQQADISLTLAATGLTITISDDGVGLPADLDPGVGLASMRERTEELGGAFFAGSNGGRGTVITATLPLSGPEQSQADWMGSQGRNEKRMTTRW